jgi:uncharacterized protein DUF4082
MTPPVVYLAAGTAQGPPTTAYGWGGANPAQVADGSDYEMGTAFRAEQDISVTHIRVFSGATPAPFVGRRGRLWSSAGAELATVVMDDALPAGWAPYPLASPVAVTAGTIFIVSFSSAGNYAATSGAFTAAGVPSPDGKVTAVKSSVGQLNGIFNNTPGSFPTESFGDTFYGVDVGYAGSPASGGLVYFPVRY